MDPLAHITVLLSLILFNYNGIKNDNVIISYFTEVAFFIGSVSFCGPLPSSNI